MNDVSMMFPSVTLSEPDVKVGIKGNTIASERRMGYSNVQILILAMVLTLDISSVWTK